jgi:hypothetical protein
MNRLRPNLAEIFKITLWRFDGVDFLYWRSGQNQGVIRLDFETTSEVLADRIICLEFLTYS